MNQQPSPWPPHSTHPAPRPAPHAAPPMAPMPLHVPAPQPAPRPAPAPFPPSHPAAPPGRPWQGGLQPPMPRGPVPGIPPPPVHPAAAGQLGYATPAAARPGAVTALGVCGLIVGVLSFLASIGASVQAVLFHLAVNTFASETLSAGARNNLGPAERAEIHLSLGPAYLIAMEAVTSAGLAVFLVVIAIQTLGGSKRGVDRHRSYAPLKIIISVFGGIAAGWMWGEGERLAHFLRYAEGTESSLPGGGMSPMAAAVGAAVTLVGVAYPIVVLMILRSRAVQEYLRPKRANAAGGPGAEADPRQADALAMKLGNVR